jgi:hypothetical protein
VAAFELSPGIPVRTAVIDPPIPEAARRAQRIGIATMGSAPNKKGKSIITSRLPLIAGSTPKTIEATVAAKTAKNTIGWNRLPKASIRAGIVSINNPLRMYKRDQVRL